ncbi:MAG: hypothetical protein M1826_006994 [Phylliscum demangeonii]|nr:MAG: hypothetical protein M1826_006994 [Phylliscum demangeonii]
MSPPSGVASLDPGDNSVNGNSTSNARESEQPSGTSGSRSGSTVDSRRPSKRKLSKEDDYILQNPELFGLRRSERARKSRAVIETDSGDDEITDADGSNGDAENSDGSDDDGARRSNPVRRPTKSPSAHLDRDWVTKSHRRRSPTRPLSALGQRASTRRAATVTSYKDPEDELTDEEELMVSTPMNGVDASAPSGPAIDIVLKHRLKEGIEDRPEISRHDFEYFIKWQGIAHYHATWETADSLAKLASSLPKLGGYRRLENYYLKRILPDFHPQGDGDVPLEEKEERALLLERQAEALEECMKVERVIGYREGDEGTEYLVKWRGLFYDGCTWEKASLVIELAQPEIDRYLERSSRVPVSNRAESSLATRSKHIPIREQPSHIKHGQLRDFQVTGLNFLAYNWCKGSNVILADEMGLGKTVQTVAFISWLLHERQQEGPFLVVVPLSTVPAWAETFANWTPDINCVVMNGPAVARKMIKEHELYTDKGPKRPRINVLITTYEGIGHEEETLSGIKWQFMAVDEAHRLKNRESLLYHTLNKFHAPSRLLITGTPIQNTLSELSALMDFLMPGVIEVDEGLDLQSEAAGEKIAELTKALQPYMLRRTKEKVENDLPPKSEKIIRVELSDIQLEYYQNILTKNYTALNQGVKGHKQSLLNIMMELKKISNHPFMFANAEDRILKGSTRREDVLRGLVTSSGKMMLLDQLLTKLKKDNHRVLIFSQMVKMLDILGDYLRLRGYQFQRLDGTIAAAPRRMAINHFNAPDSNDFCFLLSTRAGGLGINLMTADTVILFDSDWNPQADLQAMARAHRIGQKHPVNVYRLVSKDTIEEEVLERARNKLMLEFITIQRGITDDGEAKQLSSRMAQAGVSLQEPTTSEDIQRILKRRGQKMFEQSDNQKKLEELDIDAILANAEEHRTEGAEGITADGGEDFLRSFEYMDVKIDLEWDQIIPRARLDEIKHDEKRKADEQYLQEFIAQNAPRKRKAPATAEDGRGPAKRTRADANGAAASSDEDNGKKRKSVGDSRDQRAAKRVRAAATVPAKEGAADESAEDDGARPLNEKEIRNLIRAYLRYGSLEDRREEVLQDARLAGRDFGLLREAIADVIKESRRLLAEEDARVKELERHTNKLLTKKERKAVLLDYKGVRRLNAETLVGRPGEMRLLRRVVGSLSDPLLLRVPGTKPAHYSHPWGPKEDGLLCVGIHKHGYGAWTQIRDDPVLGLGSKLFLGPEEERTPGAVHLVRRADYLLSILRERESASAGHAVSAGPSKAPPPETDKTRRRGQHSNGGEERRQRPRADAARPTRSRSDSGSEDEASILRRLFEPVGESLRQVQTATKEGGKRRADRAAILRAGLLQIGHHVQALSEPQKEEASLDGKLWGYVATFWPNPGTPGLDLKGMYDRCAAEEARAESGLRFAPLASMTAAKATAVDPPATASGQSLEEDISVVPR